MARIRKCDRCGEVYKPYEDKANTIGTMTFDMNDEALDLGFNYDLCPKCMSEFEAWLHAHKK